MGDPKASAVALESLLCVGFPIPTTYTHVGVYGTRPAFDRHPGTRLWTRPGLRWERGRKLDQDGKVRTNNSDDKALRGCQELGESRNPGYTRLDISRSASDATEEPGNCCPLSCTPLSPCFQNCSQDDGCRAWFGPPLVAERAKEAGVASAPAAAAGPVPQNGRTTSLLCGLDRSRGREKVTYCSCVGNAPEKGLAERSPHSSTLGAPGSQAEVPEAADSPRPFTQPSVLCSEILPFLCILHSSCLAAL